MMSPLYLCFSIGLLALELDYSNGDELPMVAFVCGKPARYLTQSGWQQAADTTDCLSDPQDILQLCQELFPRATLTNVAESTRPVTIGNWCAVNVTQCEPSEHTVTAYRCLASSFQSEALLVPSQCVFDHVHSDTECQTGAQWRPAAVAVCQRQRLTLASAAPISACGIGHFLGVEFVCCPAATTDATTYPPPSPSSPNSGSSISSSNIAQTNDVTTQQRSSDEKNEVKNTFKLVTALPVKHDESEQRADMNSPANMDMYLAYVADEPNQLNNEHEYYMAAKQQLTTRQQTDMSKFIKEWSDAEAEELTLKSTDTNNSDVMNSKYRELHRAKLSEHRQQRKALLDVHQKRVQIQLDSKREKLLSTYTSKLKNKRAKSEKILGALKHYLRAEQKDRQHAVQYYTHLLDVDPGEAMLLQKVTEEHLRQVDKRMRQALALLNTRPHIASNIKQRLVKFMKKFTTIDEAFKQVFDKENEDELPTQILDDYVKGSFTSSEGNDSTGREEQTSNNDVAHQIANSLLESQAGLTPIRGGKHYSTPAMEKRTVLVLAGIVAGLLLLIGIAALIKHVRSARDTVSSSAVIQHRSAHTSANDDHDLTKHFDGFANPSSHASTINETMFLKESESMFYHPSNASSLLATHHNDNSCIQQKDNSGYNSQYYLCTNAHDSNQDLEEDDEEKEADIEAEQRLSVQSLMAVGMSDEHEPMSESDEEDFEVADISQAPNVEESDNSDDDTLI